MSQLPHSHVAAVNHSDYAASVMFTTVAKDRIWLIYIALAQAADVLWICSRWLKCVLEAVCILIRGETDMVLSAHSSEARE